MQPDREQSRYVMFLKHDISKHHRINYLQKD